MKVVNEWNRHTTQVVVEQTNETLKDGPHPWTDVREGRLTVSLVVLFSCRKMSTNHVFPRHHCWDCPGRLHLAGLTSEALIVGSWLRVQRAPEAPASRRHSLWRKWRGKVVTETRRFCRNTSLPLLLSSSTIFAAVYKCRCCIGLVHQPGPRHFPPDPSLQEAGRVCITRHRQN